MEDIRNGGFTIKEMLEEGYALKQMREFLKLTGFFKNEMKESGFCAKDMKEAGQSDDRIVHNQNTLQMNCEREATLVLKCSELG